MYAQDLRSDIGVQLKIIHRSCFRAFVFADEVGEDVRSE